MLSCERTSSSSGVHLRPRSVTCFSISFSDASVRLEMMISAPVLASVSAKRSPRPLEVPETKAVSP